MAQKKWIQKLDEGALHRQLGFPESQKIPEGLLQKIDLANIGDKIVYTVNGKKKTILVTRLLKQQVNAAITLKKLRK